MSIFDNFNISSLILHNLDWFNIFCVLSDSFAYYFSLFAKNPIEIEGHFSRNFFCLILLHFIFLHFTYDLFVFLDHLFFLTNLFAKFPWLCLWKKQNTRVRSKNWSTLKPKLLKWWYGWKGKSYLNIEKRFSVCVLDFFFYIKKLNFKIKNFKCCSVSYISYINRFLFQFKLLVSNL